MFKLIIFVLAILAASVIDITVERALEINLSAVSTPRRIAHGVVLKLTGAMIAAAVWFV